MLGGILYVLLLQNQLYEKDQPIFGFDCATLFL